MDADPPSSTDFADALRAAIRTRGFSLDQLRKVLARQGVTVSVATLSYWQSGRSRPERASSLAAIGPLEEALDLPRGFLASRLPSSRPADEDAMYVRAVIEPDDHDEREKIDRAVAQLGLRLDQVSWVSTHDRLTIDEQGHERAHDSRLLLRAEVDGYDRHPVWFGTDDVSTLPIVTAMSGCRVGRVREFPELHAVAVEMLLDRPLRQGEVMFMDYRQTFVGPQSRRDYTRRRVVSSSREVVLEVVFDHRCLPSRATATHNRDGQEVERELVMGPRVQAHFFDQAPGWFKLSWTW